MNGARLFSPLRLRAGIDISGFPPGARVVLQALKTYGMILADNGGNWFLRVGNPVFVQIVSQTEFPVVNPAS
jgi:hypothetical protein